MLLLLYVKRTVFETWYTPVRSNNWYIFPGIIPQGNIQMHGIKKLTVFSRRVFSAAQSQLDLSAPTLTQTFRTQVFGDDGQDGKDGVAGPVGRATSHKNYCFSIKNRYVLWLS